MVTATDNDFYDYDAFYSDFVLVKIHISILMVVRRTDNSSKQVPSV